MQQPINAFAGLCMGGSKSITRHMAYGYENEIEVHSTPTL